MLSSLHPLKKWSLRESRGGSKPGFTVVLGRTSVQDSDDLETLAQQVQEQLSASADPEFTKHLHTFDVSGREARRMQFFRRQQGILVHQDQVLLLAKDESDAPLLVQFIATSTNPTGMTPAERSRFEEMLATVEFRDEPPELPNVDYAQSSSDEDEGADA